MSGPGAVDRWSSRWSSPPTYRRWPASRPRSFTTRLPGCQGRFVCRWSSVTSRDSTLDEAAHRLRWPAGTLRSRLARARDKLRRGLTRRGLVLPAAALAADSSHSIRLGLRLTRLCDSTTPSRDPIRGRTGRLVLGGVPCPGGASSHVHQQAETDRDDLVAHCRRRHRRGISHALSSEPGRAQTAARRSAAADCGQVRRHKPASGPGSDVRRRPRARPTGKTGTQCHDDGLCGDQAAGERRRVMRR